MTTVRIDDQLINQIIKTGHYQSAQHAVESILLEYMQKQQHNHFARLCVNLDMEDAEVDELFQRSKDIGRTMDL